jgi:hypothetical protein
MITTRTFSSVALPLLLCAALSSSQAQGKGKGPEHKADKGQGHAAAKQEKPKAEKATARADKSDKSSKPNKAVGLERSASRGKSASNVKELRESGGTVGKPDFHVLASSNKHGQRLAGRALARASKRGVGDDAFIINPGVGRVQVLNRSGALLLDLDDDRDVGTWKVVTAKETNKKGSPAFCRSGAGHPVWGRQWCVDKGFGLGEDQGVRWARAIGFDNVVFRSQPTTSIIERNVLLDVLGDVVFNRLATHAISLGLAEPLAGRWIGEPAGGPRVLLLTSGDRPVAEIVDTNRDRRADLMLVTLRP